MKAAFLLVIAMLISSQSHAWRRMDNLADNAANIYTDYYNQFDVLPTKGTVSKKPWSDTYWPSQKGGAAWRWQRKNPSHPIFYDTKGPRALAKMSETELDTLSPAEKYDILMNRFDYPTVDQERKRTSADHPKWFGLCHAVAMVQTNYQEPEPRTYRIVLPDGTSKNLTFQSSDIKALLAMALNQATTQFGFSIGSRCESNSVSSSGRCWDTHPATFYIALGNSVGMMEESLILDVDPGAEVWNAAVVSYSAKITPKKGVSAAAARGTLREVRVDLTLEQIIGAQPNRAKVGAKTKKVSYSFTLEIGRDEEILGGEWISNNRPDMVWNAPFSSRLGGYFAELENMTQRLKK
ncbi:MAG: hypothetical protein AAB250_16755 [Bdellovibrionota bacterium]